MRWIKAGAFAGVVLVAGLAAPAGAEPLYPGGTSLPPSTIPVLGEQLQVAPAAAVLGASIDREDGVAGLPVTGADLVGLAALGLGGIGAGTVLVRRGRARA